MAEYVKRDIIFPGRDYNWIDLPKDAVITNVVHNGGQVDVYYTSNSDKMYDNEGGFEYFSFKEGENVNLTMSTEKETRKCIYAKVEENRGKKILIMICRWEKK